MVEIPPSPRPQCTVSRMRKRRKQEQSKRHEVKVRYNDADYAALCELVSRTPYSREEFIRRATRGAKLCENLPADYPGILRELRRIGSNVDQLLVKARVLGFVDEVLLRSIKEQVNRMDAVFGQSFGDWEGRRRTWR